MSLCSIFSSHAQADNPTGVLEPFPAQALGSDVAKQGGGGPVVCTLLLSQVPLYVPWSAGGFDCPKPSV